MKRLLFLPVAIALTACTESTSLLQPDAADPDFGVPPQQAGARRTGTTPDLGEPGRATAQLSRERAAAIREQLAADAARAPRGTADDAARSNADADALRRQAAAARSDATADAAKAEAEAQREASALREEAEAERQRRVRQITGG